eukprot:TRINITY_DN67430_c0_g1_i2.p1 TRINITY_DN67430_c0_g1~~TRINITY_DN67430_c0_g1_i2.p1  ORF type:complete len:477 (+),score=70.38 TRINITY_DN67430_c0_g1_i2:163-1593(+)
MCVSRRVLLIGLVAIVTVATVCRSRLPSSQSLLDSRQVASALLKTDTSASQGQLAAIWTTASSLLTPDVAPVQTAFPSSSSWEAPETPTPDACFSPRSASTSSSEAGLFRQYYNYYNARWPLSRQQRFDFLDLQEVMAVVSKSAQLVGYSVTIGPLDFATSWLLHAKGLVFPGARGLAFEQEVFKSLKDNPPSGDMVKGRSHAAVQKISATPTNILQVLKREGAPLEFDVLKVDIDGYECDLIEGLLHLGYKPRVLIVEANAAWPPPLRFRLAFDETWDFRFATLPEKGHRYKKSLEQVQPREPGGLHPLFHGCSLQALWDIVRTFGYVLLQYPMEDAWFIHKDHAAAFGLHGQHPVHAYRLGNPHFFSSGLWRAGDWGELPRVRNLAICIRQCVKAGSHSCWQTLLARMNSTIWKEAATMAGRFRHEVSLSEQAAKDASALWASTCKDFQVFEELDAASWGGGSSCMYGDNDLID